MGPSAPFPGGRGPGGRLTSGQRPVTEGTRIAIDVQLARFKASDEEEIVFPADMSNHDRAVVHAECKKLGSSRRATERVITVRFTSPSPRSSSRRTTR